MLHQSLIVGLGFALIPYRLGPVAEPLAILAGTLAGCFAISEIIKRVAWLRPCFGLKAGPDRARPQQSVALTREDCA
jgi:hypothetical protein